MDTTAAVTSYDSWQIPVRNGVIHSRLPCTGELIWVHVDSKQSRFASRTSGISMTNTTNGSRNNSAAEGENRRLHPHLCIVLENPAIVTVSSKRRYWTLFALIVHNWSQYSDPAAHIQEIGFSWNLPLPPPPGRMAQPTPREYGDPIGIDFVPEKQGWVLIEERPIHMGFNGRFRPFSPPVILSEIELSRLSAYLTRMSSMQPTMGDNFATGDQSDAATGPSASPFGSSAHPSGPSPPSGPYAPPSRPGNSFTSKYVRTKNPWDFSRDIPLYEGTLVAADAYEPFEEDEYINCEMAIQPFEDVYSLLHPEYELARTSRQVEVWLGTLI